MPVERHSPDGVTLTNLSGSLADIDEDPDDALDTTWAVASNNNVDTEANCTFPTPTGGLNTGAGLQEFRAKVRKFSATQSGTPQVRLDLYEGGVLKQTGSAINVTSAVSQIVSQTWDASLLSDIAGTNVEVRVVGLKTGGSPGVRNTVDVAAVEWNADYATGPLQKSSSDSGSSNEGQSVVAQVSSSDTGSAVENGSASSTVFKTSSDTGTATESHGISTDYEWWNGSAWVDSETFVTSGVEGAVVPATDFANGTWEWDVATSDGIASGPYSAPFEMVVTEGQHKTSSDTGTATETEHARIGGDTGTIVTESELVFKDEWWDGAAWVTTPTYITSATQAVSIPATSFDDSATYEWTVRTKDALVEGPEATPFEFSLTSAVGVSDGDTGAGTDGQSLVAAIPSSDTGAVSETQVVARTSASSDAGTATETQSLAVARTSSDTGTATEAETRVVTLISTDTGVGTDAQSLSAALSSSDTGTGTDGAGQTAQTKSGGDTGTATETQLVARTSTSSDTGSATETQALQQFKTSSDSGTSSENATQAVALASSDTATATETQALAQAKTSSDTATATETQTRTADITSSDTGVANETQALVVDEWWNGVAWTTTKTWITSADQFLSVPAADFAGDQYEWTVQTRTADGLESPEAEEFDFTVFAGTLKTSSDTGTGTDAQSVARVSTSSDSGATTETERIFITSSDTGSGTETHGLTVALTSSDSGVGSEADSAGAPKVSSDAGAATETQSVARVSTSSDTGTSSETQLVTVSKTSSDTGTLATEGRSLVVNLTKSDTGTSTETVVLLSRGGGDTGSATETQSLQVFVTSSDSGTGNDGSGFAEQTKVWVSTRDRIKNIQLFSGKMPTLVQLGPTCELARKPYCEVTNHRLTVEVLSEMSLEVV